MKKLLLSLLLLIFGVSIYSVNAAIVINEMMANPDVVSDRNFEITGINHNKLLYKDIEKPPEIQ